MQIHADIKRRKEPDYANQFIRNHAPDHGRKNQGRGSYKFLEVRKWVIPATHVSADMAGMVGGYLRGGPLNQQ